MRRWAVIATLTMAFAMAPNYASAHGGPLAFAGDVGPYSVQAYRAIASVNGQETLLYTLRVHDRSDGSVVTDANVTIEVSAGGESTGGPLAVRGAEYEGRIRLPDSSSGWNVSLVIDGSSGRGEVTHRLEDQPPLSETVAPWVIPVLMIALARTLRRVRNYGWSGQSAAPP